MSRLNPPPTKLRSPKRGKAFKNEHSSPWVKRIVLALLVALFLIALFQPMGGGGPGYSSSGSLLLSDSLSSKNQNSNQSARPGLRGSPSMDSEEEEEEDDDNDSMDVDPVDAIYGNSASQDDRSDDGTTSSSLFKLPSLGWASGNDDDYSDDYAAEGEIAAALDDPEETEQVYYDDDDDDDNVSSGRDGTNDSMEAIDYFEGETDDDTDQDRVEDEWTAAILGLDDEDVDGGDGATEII